MDQIGTAEREDLTNDALWLANAPVEDMTAEEIAAIENFADEYQDPYLVSPTAEDIDDDDATLDEDYTDPVITASPVAPSVT